MIQYHAAQPRHEVPCVVLEGGYRQALPPQHVYFLILESLAVFFLDCWSSLLLGEGKVKENPAEDGTENHWHEGCW